MEAQQKASENNNKIENSRKNSKNSKKLKKLGTSVEGHDVTTRYSPTSQNYGHAMGYSPTNNSNSPALSKPNKN